MEIGLSDAIPLVVSIKTYPGELELGALTLRPLAGLGVGLAFIPGVTLQAYFFLVGIEVPLGDTQFTAFGE
ncbi:MAG: hypothetical protein U9Q23_02645, partial [Candidatus Bipolaricaulota bacterium]|nr:hypothetical protein [Candidatus Bipolaricaulota bacterium]